MTYQRAEWLFGYDVGQQNVCVGCFEVSALSGQCGTVRCVHVTCASKILLNSFGTSFDWHGLVADVVGAEEVSKVQLGCCTGLNADSRAIKLSRGGHAEVFGDHEALTVVVVHANEFELKVRITGECPRCVTCQQIDFAGSERGKACFACGRDESHGIAVTQYSRCHGATHSHVETLPNAIRVGLSEAGNACGHTTVQRAARFDFIKCGRKCAGCCQRCCSQSTQKQSLFHIYLFLIHRPCYRSGLFLAHLLGVPMIAVRKLYPPHWRVRWAKLRQLAR